MEDYSNLIKELRNKMIVTQEELSKILNVSFGSVNRWENAKYEPSIKIKRKLKELCNQYNISFDSYVIKNNGGLNNE